MVFYTSRFSKLIFCVNAAEFASKSNLQQNIAQGVAKFSPERRTMVFIFALTKVILYLNDNGLTVLYRVHYSNHKTKYLV